MKSHQSWCDKDQGVACQLQDVDFYCKRLALRLAKSFKPFRQEICKRGYLDSSHNTDRLQNYLSEMNKTAQSLTISSCIWHLQGSEWQEENWKTAIASVLDIVRIHVIKLKYSGGNFSLIRFHLRSVWHKPNKALQ